MAKDLYASPRYVENLSDCLFYHTMDLPAIGLVEGHWDLRGRLDDYIGGVSVRGRRVLDIGCASGFLTIEMEKNGASVVSFDAESADSTARLPFKDSLYTTNRGEWRRQLNLTLDRLKNSYWLAHRLNASGSKAFWGDVYDLPDELGMFDVVVVGQILVHLRDPITALGSVARRCSDTLVITEGMIDSDDPIMRLCANPETGPDWSWCHLSRGLYAAIMRMIGFDIVKITENRFICNWQKNNDPVLLQTLVAKRNPTAKSGPSSEFDDRRWELGQISAKS
jgi:SAM-dependent methyltransferase